MSEARQQAIVALEAKIQAKAPRQDAAAPTDPTPAAPATPAAKDTPAPPAKPDAAPPADAGTKPPASEPANAATPTDDGEGEDTEDSAASDGANPTAARPRKGVGKRIDELTREKYEERRAREAAEARIAELERRLQAGQAPQPQQHAQTPPIGKGRPTLEQFGYDQDAYEAARDAWVIAQAKETWTQEQQQRDHQQKLQERLGKFESRIAKFEQENPGAWDEVLRSPVQPTQLMRDAVADSEIGPAMAHHLARNLDEAYAISQMPPVQQALAMGRLEERLLQAHKKPPSAPNPPPTTTTRAPAPPPVLPSGSPSGSTPAARMSIEDHIEAVRAKKANRRT